MKDGFYQVWSTVALLFLRRSHCSHYKTNQQCHGTLVTGLKSDFAVHFLLMIYIQIKCHPQLSPVVQESLNGLEMDMALAFLAEDDSMTS